MSLSAAQIGEFERQGFLVVPNLLEPEDLSPLACELEAWVDERAHALRAQGHIDHLHEGCPFEERYARLFAQSPLMGAALDIAFLRGEALFALMCNRSLLDAVESLVGPEITLNPIHHLRAKVPQEMLPEAADSYFNVPWHQDSGVMWEEADPIAIVSVWLPLVDATVENGCMQAMPGVARTGHLPHQAEGGTTIVPECLPEVEPVPLACPVGGVVFQNKFTPHRSTPNRTCGVRWSLDLRYQPANTPTGRPFHPPFEVRSARHPERVCRYAEWQETWRRRLAELAENPAPPAHRVVR